LGNCPEHVLDLVDGFAGVDDFVVNNGVHFAGNVVAGDGFLFGDVNGFGADVDFSKVLVDGPDQMPSGFKQAGVAAHGVDDSSFVLVDLFEEGKDEDKNKDGDDGKDSKGHRSSIYFLDWGARSWISLDSSVSSE